MNMLLLEKVHVSFEQWFIHLFLQDLLPTGDFSIIGLRKEYLALCWKEELLWQKWSENAAKQK